MPTNPRRLIARLEEQAKRNAMGYTERYDYDAERFYRETGFMAPGKSMPLEMCSGFDDETCRNDAWNAWTQQLRNDFQALLQDCLDSLRTTSQDSK